MDVEATITHVSVEEIHPGIYRTKKTVAKKQPKEPREEILQHLQKMEKQPLSNEEDEKRTLEYLGSRENMKKLSGFFYKEHLSFSAMDSAAKSNPDFPVGWNMHNLPGKLTELLQVCLVHDITNIMIYQFLGFITYLWSFNSNVLCW